MNFELSHRVQDRPGSWTAMLATKPPCRYAGITFTDSGLSEVHLSYMVKTTSENDFLLVGDIVAVLAECQNRAEMGVDGADSARDPISRVIGDMEPDAESYMKLDPTTREFWNPAMESIPTTEGCIKVAVHQGWLVNKAYPAFSLRRLYRPQTRESKAPLYELTVHKMVVGQYEYNLPFSRDCPLNHFKEPVQGQYEANLVAVRSHKDEIGYLEQFEDVYRLLPDIEEQSLP